MSYNRSVPGGPKKNSIGRSGDLDDIYSVHLNSKDELPFKQNRINLFYLFDFYNPSNSYSVPDGIRCSEVFTQPYYEVGVNLVSEPLLLSF